MIANNLLYNLAMLPGMLHLSLNVKYCLAASSQNIPVTGNDLSQLKGLGHFNLLHVLLGHQIMLLRR